MRPTPVARAAGPSGMMGAMPPMVDPAATFRRAFEIFRAHFAVLYPAALVFALVDAMVSFAVRDQAELLPATLALSLVLNAIFQGMVVELVRDVRDGEADVSVGQLFRGISPVAGRLVAVALVSGIAMGIGFVLLVVPGLILMTIWAVAAPVVVMERTGAFASLDRSRELVRGHGWQVFLTLLLMLLFTLGVGFVAGLVALGAGQVAGSFIEVLLVALVTPVTALVAGVLYLRLLEIRDGRAEVPRGYAAGGE
ncbi:hypothetical protein [Patulibacter sp. SYSU D01012]|uniref:hypothetical protein n=1 Tax=Patulibacter sp. SYSU D01012 TaxID=2817381 RepID=UPI001B316B4D|nr:hypothetical protein [Patulibacter sp. SYSU D01012]